jgi:hypothetical protein
MSRNKNHKVAFDGTPSETGEACYWARFDYLKLRETLEAIVAAMETTAKEDLPSEAAADTKLRLVVSNDRPDDEKEPPAEGPEPIPA